MGCLFFIGHLYGIYVGFTRDLHGIQRVLLLLI